MNDMPPTDPPVPEPMLPEPSPGVERLRKEAAARRRQLRDVEQERDALRERVVRQEKQQVEGNATELGFRSMVA